MIQPVTSAGFNDAVLGDRPAVVIFGASWCPPCKVIKSRLSAISENFEWVDFYSVDADTDTAVFTRFGVRQVPTIAAFQDGQLKDSILAGLSTPQLMTWIDGVFEEA